MGAGGAQRSPSVAVTVLGLRDLVRKIRLKLSVGACVSVWIRKHPRYDYGNAEKRAADHQPDGDFYRRPNKPLKLHPHLDHKNPVGTHGALTAKLVALRFRLPFWEIP